MGVGWATNVRHVGLSWLDYPDYPVADEQNGLRKSIHPLYQNQIQRTVMLCMNTKTQETHKRDRRLLHEMLHVLGSSFFFSSVMKIHNSFSVVTHL